MKRSLLLSLCAASLAGCFYTENPVEGGLSSFDVTTGAVLTPLSGTSTKPADVVGACAARYGGVQSTVPGAVRGTKDCPYAMPSGDVLIVTSVKALDETGALLNKLNKNISFRVVPGDLTGTDYSGRTTQLTNGIAAGVRVRAAHLYGQVRVWAEDAPPQPIYSNGSITGNPPTEIPGARTYATGLSDVIYFEEPTLASVQFPDNNDGKSSPLVNQFLVIGKTPESGSKLYQSCSDDPERNGKEVQMVVTATDNAGFFVTDLTACRRKETYLTGFDPEPSGFLPGTFGSMYVYNYSYPDGLFRGDLLFTVSGSVQEFTSTTQLTFAAWTIADKVRQYPESEWNKWLGQLSPVELNARICGLRNATSDVTDVLCGGYTNNSMKLESLESTLVKVRNVRMPDTFANCDLNGNGEVTFFCVSGSSFGPCADSVPENDKLEAACNIQCTTATGPYAGTRCTDDTSYEGFGQFVVELAGPGPREAVLDDALPSKFEWVNVGLTSASTTATFKAGDQLAVWCETDVHYRAGTVAASDTDPLLPANQVTYVPVANAGDRLALMAASDVPGARCSVGKSPRTRLLVMTKDAVPTLNPKCDVNDADPTRAEQCRNLRGASFDIVGHLRHVQPARPRWMVIPRDEDDLCCRPGPGLSCPKPIKPCP